MDVTFTELVDRPGLCLKAGDVLTLHDVTTEELVKLIDEDLNGLIKIHRQGKTNGI